MPKVSVVVPVYNAEKFLEKTISAILNQSYKDYELILINDGSKDGSLNICQKFADLDSRIIVIDQENKGAGGARNTGIVSAKGQYLMFIDADDFCENSMIECMVHNIEQTGAELGICGCNVTNRGGIKQLLPGEEQVLKGQKFFEQFISLSEKKLINSLCNKIYLVDIIRNNHILIDETLIVGEDFRFNLDYIDKCRCVSLVNKPLYNYVTDNSYTTKRYREEDFRCRVKNAEAYIAFCEKHNICGNGYFQYIKLLFSEAIQMNGKSCLMNNREKRRHLKEIMASDLMKEAVKKSYAKDMPSKVLLCFAKIGNAQLLLVFAKLIAFVKKHHIVKWRRVSI